MMHLVVQFTLTVYQYTEKVQKLKKILYWFIISFFHHSYKPFFLSLCVVWLFSDFHVHYKFPIHPSGQSRWDGPGIRGLLWPGTDCRIHRKVQSESQTQTGGRRAGAKGISVSQQIVLTLLLISYLYITFMVVRKPFFTVNCLQEVHKFCTHSNIMHINKVHKYYMYLALK